MTPTPETLKLALTARDRIVAAGGPSLGTGPDATIYLPALVYGEFVAAYEARAALHLLNWWCDAVFVWAISQGVAVRLRHEPHGLVTEVETVDIANRIHDSIRSDFLTAKIHAVASVAERIGKDKT